MFGFPALSLIGFLPASLPPYPFPSLPPSHLRSPAAILAQGVTPMPKSIPARGRWAGLVLLVGV